MDRTTVPSNERLVEELTKEFTESISLSDDITSKTKDSDVEETTDVNIEKKDNSEKACNGGGDESKELGTSDSEEEELYIDEEHLQEQETKMSEEEKLEAREEALDLKKMGNTAFQKEQYKEALSEYTKALNICPLSYSKERSILYANSAACRSKLGLKETAVMDCTKAIELNPNYLKAQLRRAQLYRDLDKLDEALKDYQMVLEMDPNVLEARQACMTLPEEITERNEKLKTEMIGKLKDLGNLFLRPFGLSTDNFNLVQDTSTGGYSVNFQNNRKCQ